MAFHKELDPDLQRFIKDQKIFFSGTAGAEGKVNISPKGMDTFRIVNPLRVIWLNLTGSGNETAAHLLENGRITIMFNAFDGKPKILRLYGSGRSIHPYDSEWENLINEFPEMPSARQIVDIQIELIQTSCGFGVPLYDFVGLRDHMDKWADNKGEKGIREYWEEKNQMSLDGKPTGILPN